ncbi:MAG: hypothetical protein DMF56_12330 [Acidobacteria bacterium]|nr:MAG: hypothetical protein DMF56_12330 [Acidobacteriota bacterium]
MSGRPPTARTVVCGPFGYDEACDFSDFREWFDQKFKGDSAADSEADQKANRFGRSQAKKYPKQSCKSPLWSISA